MIGFLGLSHLGIVSSVAMASRGFEILGFDLDATIVEALAGGDAQVAEPGLDECLEGVVERVRWSNDVEAISECSLVYIAQDVPTADDGTSDLGPVRQLVALAVENASPDTTIVIHSQVPPGTTRSFQEVAESKGCTVAYQVETLIFGCALERALNPERFIVGLPAGDSPIPDELQAVLDSFDCPILPMRYESAELAKIAINTMLVASIQATDMLADVCELVGADWDEVVPSLRLDRRIGEFAYLAPSLGVGGSNLERDLVTLQAVASTAGIKLPLVATWREMSERRRDWSYRTIADSIAEIGFGTRIAILGLAYKPNTDSTRNSPGLLLLEQLQEAGASVVWHDPIVTSPADIEQLRTMSAREAAAGADVVVLTTAWDEYKELTGSVIKKLAPGALVVDPHGVLDRPTFVGAGSRYITMGSGLGT